MDIKKFRDLTLLELNDSEQLVIACDSCGGVGLKEKDLVKVSPYIVGRFISRVPLLEVICSGAEPISVINTLAVEMEPTGREIIRGITEELKLLDLDPELLLNGSTEDNIPTVQTALGITVIGKLNNTSLRLGQSKQGDKLCLVGLPKVGDEVRLDDPEIIDLKTIKALLETQGIKEILPVGSKGINYEAELLAKNIGCSINYKPEVITDLKKPAGPATCAIFTIEANFYNEADLLEKLKKPICLLGELSSRLQLPN